MNEDQFISIYFNDHDANVSFFRPSDNKLLILELERIWGQRYFNFATFSKIEKPFIYKRIKDISLDFGFHPEFKHCIFPTHFPMENDFYSGIESEFKIKEYYKYFHHECHAANVFYDSGFDKSLIVSFDGGGDEGCFVVFEANKETGFKKINNEDFLDFPNYYGIAAILIKEIKKSSDFNITKLASAGKIMGLSAYGNFNQTLYDRCFNFLNTKVQPAYDSIYQSLKILNDKIEYNCLDGQKAYDLAYNLQLAFENIVLKKIKPYLDSGKYQNICLSGGGALNVLLNDRLSENYPKINFYVSNSPNDSGLSYGGLCSHFKKKIVDDPMYSGCQILDKEILQHILNYRRWRYADPILIAKEIYEGKIIGLCQGNSEVGPRALGNRTILANPCLHNIKDDINKKVKFREWFRPFAPICIKEESNKYFNITNNVNYDYMSFSPKVKENYRKTLPAITHIDGSSRLQTINKNQNSYLYEILKQFEKLSGFPILVNTSFNVKGKSILTHYQAALQNLDTTQLDGIILDGYYITK